MIRVNKEVLCEGLIADNRTYWTSYILAALMLLCLTEHRTHSCIPFTMITGWPPVLPFMLTLHTGWEEFAESGEEQEVKCYLEMLAKQAMQLDQLVISNIGDYEQRQGHLRRDKKPGPTMVYGFEIGQIVL